MTREEKQKAIDALKTSAPVMAVTQKEFNDYIQTINKIMDWLEQEPKTGHWIQTNEFFINKDGQFIYKYICSECKSLSYFRKSNKKAIGANVCPNCGAKMVERSEE